MLGRGDEAHSSLGADVYVSFGRHLNVGGNLVRQSSMARWRSGNAQIVHEQRARFEPGPGLQFDQIGPIILSPKRLTRPERIVVAIQYVVVAIFLIVIASGFWVL